MCGVNNYELNGLSISVEERCKAEWGDEAGYVVGGLPSGETFIPWDLAAILMTKEFVWF